MTDIEKTLTIAAPVEKVWAALADPQAIRAWMGDDSTVEVDLKVGGRYRLFGGDTTGAFTEVAPFHTLEYTWRQGEWPADWPDSVVRWELAAAGNATKVRLTHRAFPNKQERDSHDEGWDIYWLGPMKEWLESND